MEYYNIVASYIGLESYNITSVIIGECSLNYFKGYIKNLSGTDWAGSFSWISVGY